MRRTVLIVLLPVWAAALASAGLPAFAQRGTSIPFVTIASGPASAIHEPAQLVIRDQPAWQRLWRRHSPATAAPPVDFRRHMVIAVFAGEFDEPATVQITRIVREVDRLVVLYRAGPTRPPLDGPTMMSVGPYHIVRVPRSALPVIFSRIKTPPVLKEP